MRIPNHSPSLHAEMVDFDAYRDRLYHIRTKVFVEEQGVPESIEHDDEDPLCQHVLAYSDGEAVGTGRLTPEGRIGRMAVLPEYRRQSIGSLMLEKLLNEAKSRGHTTVGLAAQVSAVTFYERYGFVAEGAIFQEAGIDHLLMHKIL